MNSYNFLSESNQYFSEADTLQFCQTKKYQVFAYKRLYLLSNNVDYLHIASDIFKNSTLTKLLADDSLFKNDFLVYKADLFYMIGKHFLFIDRSTSEEYYKGAYQIIMKIPKYSRDAQLMKILEEINELIFPNNDIEKYQFRA